MLRSSASRLEQLRADDRTEEIAEGDKIILRQPAVRPLPPASGYSLPPVGDLDIESAYSDYIFDQETEQLRRQSFFGVTSGGDVIELETMAVTRFVVVPLEALR